MTVVFGAFGGYLWVGRGKAALIYLALSSAALAFFFWRLYAGDAWLDAAMAAPASDLLIWAGVSALSLLLVLPIRKASRPTAWYARGWGVIIALIGSTLLAMAFAVGVRSFAIQSFSAPSQSMQPALRPGDYFFVDKRAYGHGPYSLPFGPWAFLGGERIAPKRGDIAVFRHPQSPSVDYVKRVIGLPGERIQVIGGVVHIDGVALRLEPLAPGAETDPEMKDARFAREYMPEGGSYIVEDLMQGSAGDDTPEYRLPEGAYFMMGDNRDNSNDSRFGLGFVTSDLLIGRADVIFWNSNGTPFRDRRLLSPLAPAR